MIVSTMQELLRKTRTKFLLLRVWLKNCT